MIISDDVLADWKNSRYIVIDSHLIPDKIFGGGELIVLSDIVYWSEHAEELEIWCNTHGAKLQGMTVTIPDESTLVLFHLKWS